MELRWGWTARPTSYTLSRADLAEGPYVPIKTLTAKRFIDTKRRPGATYFYVVQSASPAGMSPPSSPVSVTIPG